MRFSLQRGMIQILLATTSLLSVVAVADYRIEASATRYKADFFQGFRDQRSFLFAFGYPEAETSIQQTMDSAIDSYQLALGYHFDRFNSLKATYLGKFDSELTSNFGLNAPLSDEILGQRYIQGNDRFRAKVRALTFAWHLGLPLRSNVSIGSNAGLILSRATVLRSISGSVSEAAIDIREITANKTNTKYEANPTVGLYADINYSTNWHISFQWNRYFNLGEESRFPGLVDLNGSVVELDIDYEVNVDAYSFGLVYRFK